MLSHETNLNRFKRIETVRSVDPNCTEIKVEINHIKIAGQLPNIGKLKDAHFRGSKRNTEGKQETV